ncbi:hypothetical protein KR009_003522 [Drosophila setifemur]|nr:hypothetical protein KR009_003522 [Drosophila setifemur]
MDLKTLTVVTLVLAIFACHTLANPPPANVTDCPPGNGTNNGTNPDDNDDDRFGDDGALCASFQHLRDLMDQEKLQTLIQVHYNCDGKFRRAMRFYNTTGFVKVTDDLQDTDAYQTILKELQFNRVDTTDIESVAEIFYCIILPVQKPDRDCDCKSVRGHTFVDDLLDLMPQKEVHNYIVQSQTKHTNFGNFTLAVTSREFQATLKANIKKKDVARPLRILRHNGWNIPELLRAMLTIFTW